ASNFSGRKREHHGSWLTARRHLYARAEGSDWNRCSSFYRRWSCRWPCRSFRRPRLLCRLATAPAAPAWKPVLTCAKAAWTRSRPRRLVQPASSAQPGCDKGHAVGRFPRRACCSGLDRLYEPHPDPLIPVRPTSALVCLCVLATLSGVSPARAEAGSTPGASPSPAASPSPSPKPQVLHLQAKAEALEQQILALQMQ